MTVHNHYAFRLRSGMHRGLCTEVPLPTRLVSNEEFPPLPQTAAQREVEDRIRTEAGHLARRLGLSRRDFLRTSGGMATSLLAMNTVFGRFFDVTEVEAADPAAFQERRSEAVFIFDVHATRNELPKDYLSRIKMAYLDEGATPSHRWYGWVTR